MCLLILEKKTEKESQIREQFEAPRQLNSPEIPPLELPTLETLGLNKKKPLTLVQYYNLKEVKQQQCNDYSIIL